jgi:F-type H+-transporting ATPase subunit epsilon
VIVLSDVAELAESIDVDRARRAKQRAEERASADPDDEDAQAALQRANTRLEVAGAAEHA